MANSTGADGRSPRRRAFRPRRLASGRVRPGWTAAVGGAIAAGAIVTALLPGGGPAQTAGRAVAAQPSRPATAHPAAATTCDPRKSLRPSASTSGPALQRIKNRKPARLIVGVDQNSYLWGYRNPATGSIQGFDINLVHAVAKAIFGKDWKDHLQLKTVPTANRQKALADHQVDIVVRTMTAACDRMDGSNGQPGVAFSSIYFEASQELLVPKTSPITGFNGTLKGRRVCTADRSSGQQLLEKSSYGSRPTYLANQLDCLVRLQLGTVDAVVSDSALVAGQAAQDPAVKVLSGDPKGQDPYAIAVNKNDTDLVRFVNKVLADYRKSGWMSSYNAWLKPRLGSIGGPPKAQYQ